MTFYEAALRVLEEAGAPMHFQEITKRSLDKGLLSHIGKVPEQTMLARLAAQAKRSRDRRLIVTARDTFALSDWLLNEDPDALALTGTIEPNPEEGLPPLRATERHPEPRAEYLRAIGRQAERNRRRDDDGKRKKYPPLAEVAHEVLTEAGALVPAELIARLKARDLVDEVGTLTLLEGLADDNQQRLDQGRRPQFTALRSENNELQLSVDTAPAESALPGLTVQETFCKAANLPFENGRVVLRSQRRRDEGPSVTAAVSPEDLALMQVAKSQVKEARKAMARVFRRKLIDLETGTFEKACVKLLHANGFRELKVARRAKEGSLLSARKKEGSIELRFAVRILKGSGPVERRQVQDLRRDVSQVSANVGLLLTPGEARGDARSEATTGGALTFLWCGDQLAEKFFEAEVGVHVTRVELFEIDDAFFDQARADAEESQKRRDERQRDRGDVRREPATDEVAASAEPAPGPKSDEAPLAAESSPVAASEAEGDDDEGDDDDEGPETEPGAEGVSADGAEGKKRRRRRRRRRRGGARPDGLAVTATPGAPVVDGTASAERPAEAPAPAPAAPPEPPAGESA